MIILDTGPLVAALSTKDHYHSWAYQQFKENPFPFITCESVITEAVFFLQQESKKIKGLHNLLTSGAIEITFSFQSEKDSIFRLMEKYENRNRPMDFADACLVRMAEKHSNGRILTIDSDFIVYRKHRNQPLDVIMPS